MEIKLPLNTQSQIALTRFKDSPLTLKVGQIVDVTVLQTNQDTDSLTLELANKTLQVQSNQSLVLTPGDKLKLEVMRLNPNTEFKVINLASDKTYPPPLASSKKLQAESLLLKLPIPLVEDKNATIKTLTLPQTAYIVKEPLTAKVVTVSEHHVQFQLQTGPVDTKSRSLIQIALDRATASSLKPGQTVTLGPNQTGLTPEVKITDLIKQYLPIHEPPVQFIDQLLKSMPALQQNEQVPAALKRLALEIMQNLPRQQQLTQSTFLKQAITQSGLFLEAKLASIQEPSPSLTGNDFKAQLLKLIEVLKHETGPQNDSKSTPAELQQLKILLQKTEGSVAKVILDQLASLPKEENTQQLWALEIPFLDKQKAESVKIEIEQDKQRNASSDSATWAVTITITPPNLGTLHCKVSYLDGVINTHFWSQQEAVTRLIKQNLDTLRQQLEDSGLKTGRLDALEGEPPASRLQGHSKEKLLDEKV